MKPRILFVHNYPTQFVQTDSALLRERYIVREWYQRRRLVNIPALVDAIRQTDLVYGWFASWHAFVPLLLARASGRPAVLVVGGYDTANMPEIDYGHQRGGLKRQIALSSMQWATRLVTHSAFAKQEVIRNAKIDPDRITVIYLGLADDPLVGADQKQDLVATAANVDRANLTRKGLEAFTRAAGLMPTIHFVLIGGWRDNTVSHLRLLAAPNIAFTGWLSRQEMNEYFSLAKAYVQASRHETFGLAVAEAMLHNCVPVVTHAGALPEVVGDTGIYVESAEPATVADGIQRALLAGEALGQRARERVRCEFPIQRRRANLLDLVDQTLQSRKHD